MYKGDLSGPSSNFAERKRHSNLFRSSKFKISLK